MRAADLEFRPHALGTPNGELRVSVQVVHKPTGKIIEADAINLRSRISRRRLAESIARQVYDADADRIDRALLALIPQAEADAIAQPTSPAESLPFPDVKPWPDPVSGERLLSFLEGFLQRYIILPQGAALTISTWLLAAWSIDKWDRFPYLLVHSPTKRCGKTRLLSALSWLCPRPLNAANISAAALYRAVEQFQPTLLIDEAQWLTRRGNESAEGLRELLCAGAERSATVLRVGGPDRDTLQRFRVYSPKVLAHIGDPDDVLADRSIVIRMERKTAGDHVEPWRSRRVEMEARELAEQICRWSADHRDELAAVYDRLEPFGLGNDRAGEMYLPLQAVLTVADPARLSQLEQTARALTPADTDRESAGIQLLAALREILEPDFLPTETILDRLHARIEEPWATWRQGKAMTAEALARQLRHFEVRPAQSPDKSCRGYYRASLMPAWDRYLILNKPVQPVQPVPDRPKTGPVSDRSDRSDRLSAYSPEDAGPYLEGW
jgi:hypothetical protein